MADRLTAVTCHKEIGGKRQATTTFDANSWRKAVKSQASLSPLPPSSLSLLPSENKRQLVENYFILIMPKGAHTNNFEPEVNLSCQPLPTPYPLPLHTPPSSVHAQCVCCIMLQDVPKCGAILYAQMKSRHSQQAPFYFITYPPRTSPSPSPIAHISCLP